MAEENKRIVTFNPPILDQMIIFVWQSRDLIKNLFNLVFFPASKFTLEFWELETVDYRSPIPADINLI